MNRAGVNSRPVNSGSGFCFVDHIGNVCPSGFLPLPCGNVKKTPASEIYRSHPTFREWRDLTKLKGKCDFRDIRDRCSGRSRARAFGLTGNYLNPEPFCAYEPAAELAAAL